MENADLAAKVKLSIEQKTKSFSYFMSLRKQEENIFGEKLPYQSLTDAAIGTMASIIDYYCIYCALKVSPTRPIIRQIQYRPIGKKQLIDAIPGKKETCPPSPHKSTTHKEIINEIIEETLQVKPDKINTHDYWTIHFGYFTHNTLKKYKVTEGQFSFEVDMEHKKKTGDIRIKLDPTLQKYHECMHIFRKYPNIPKGICYDLYLEINNCTKHNIAINVADKICHFTDPQEVRVYHFFKIGIHDDPFIGNGILKNLLATPYSELQDCLDFKSTNQNMISPLEEKWEMGLIIKNANQDDRIDSSEDILYFFVDRVFLAKTKESIFIDIDRSLELSFNRLIDEVTINIKRLEKQGVAS